MIRYLNLVCVLFVTVLCGCADSNKKVVKIAVTGSPSAYSEYYEKGIKLAYQDVKEEYKNSGFEIKCEFYDDKNDYKTAEKITGKLVEDSEVTAIIASQSPNICENQAFRTNKTGKILICPHWIYDDTFTENSYDKVFALCISSSDTGYVMGRVAESIDINRWAVCKADDEISNKEVESLKKNININTIDFVDIDELSSNFENIVKRWKLIGIEGVVFIPYDNSSFKLFYKLKEELPNIYVISDSYLDNNTEFEKNSKYFNNTYMVESFYLDSGESDKFIDEEYLDTWEIHGYNTFRVVVDTAVKNDTNDPSEIAKILHNEGYNGALENFKFNDKGMLESKYCSVARFKDNEIEGYVIEMDK